MSDFEVLTTGKYGGIGSLIRQRRLCAHRPAHENSPADRAGLKIGDRILAIDGKSAAGLTTEEVSKRLKGEPGSKVKRPVRHLTTLRRRRPSAANALPFRACPMRAGSTTASATSATATSPRAATRRCRRPSPNCGARANSKRLVLDYRSNGGGIMQEAVKILGLFVPKGNRRREYKGRTEDSKNSSRPSRNPFCPTCRWQC